MNEVLTNIQSYFSNRMDEYLTCLWEHISISLMALVVAMLIGIPLGYLCIRYGKSRKWIVGVFQVLRIIPSLAVLILLIPVMGNRCQACNDSACASSCAVYTDEHGGRV